MEQENENERAKENRGLIGGALETKCLIRIWGAVGIQRQLDAVTRKKKVWDTVSSKMEEQGYQKSGDAWQIRMKKFTYKKVKDHNNKSGNDNKTSQFYDVMDEVLGTRPAITPPVIVDTSVNSDYQNLSEDDNNVDIDNGDEDSFVHPAASSTPKKIEHSRGKKRSRANKFQVMADYMMEKMLDFQRQQEEKMMTLEEKRTNLEDEAEHRREEREAKQRKEEREHEYRIMELLMGHWQQILF
ncbi:hypothetical protein LOTGIDRAFT_155028 [Lottia gigantea]|uniref:Myb/SANT-like DNA-binding domain-containing protein n=1 Tax=Lottia gigantea TaxID=225164 RepID=V3ZMK7_LOTGI|nr:hypothetical protein LOTGIDRAFT_155028 [Lottia gigantea]ESO85542.1 hypothetical protein LOTGIDRAFT_155028 [Lottia gigantea]